MNEAAMTPVATDNLLAGLIKKDFEAALAGHTNGSGSLNDLRAKAFASFQETGLPGRREEEYKYVNMQALSRVPFRHGTATIAPKTVPADFLIAGVHVLRFAFVNGRYQEQLSDHGKLPQGCTVSELSQQHSHPVVKQHLATLAAHEADPFLALNTAFVHHGLLIHVAANTKIDVPLHIIHMADSDAGPSHSHPRVLVLAEAGAEVNIVTSFHSLSDKNESLVNSVTEIICMQNAAIDLEVIQTEGDNANQVNNLHIVQHRDSRVSVNTVTLGGKLVRNNLHVRLAESNCETHLYGLYLGQGSQVIDNHTTIDHAMPHCHSNELYKGVVDDNATAIFNGKVYVRPDAQKTNAFQENKNIVLTDTANVYTKPQLEIFADDVKCSHGATTGQLDEESLFYLRSRGIGKKAAHALLINAFANDIIENISVDTLKHNLLDRIAVRLQKNLPL